MDHETFDRFVRLLGTPGSRRAALAALLGGAAGISAELAAEGKKRNKRGKPNRKDRN